MLVSTRDLVQQAQASAYALGAFNVYNLEGVKAVVEAAEEEKSPVLLQIHPKALAHGGRAIIDLCLSAGKTCSVPVAVHLDHSTAESHIHMALEAGIQSVMADGSDLDYRANVSFTRKMARQAHRHDAAIEAELGKISGTEDGMTVTNLEAQMTDPEQAADFAVETGIDMLAICIGNVHGRYAGEPHLDFARLEQIRNAVDIPLVLHGASGLPESAIRRSIELGVCKFNVNTEVRRAYVQTLKRIPADADLLDIMTQAVLAMKLIIRQKLQLFGSSCKASHDNTIPLPN